jgi:hypothetical protein
MGGIMPRADGSPPMMESAAFIVAVRGGASCKGLPPSMASSLSLIRLSVSPCRYRSERSPEKRIDMETQRGGGKKKAEGSE